MRKNVPAKLRLNSDNHSHLIMSCLLASTVLFSLPAHAATANATDETAQQLPTVIVKATEPTDDSDVIGYKAGATRSSTRTDTPLIDVPQSISVVTQDQVRDQNIQSIADAIRYVPGISLHQGENNRDQVVIRGNSTSADFFLDGARDDVQYYRDLYNIDRVEVLKGSNALAFGRGGSGGVINRVTKTADFDPVRQMVLEGGSWGDRRIQGDVGDKISDSFAVRLNGMFEDSGTFRQFGDLERYGINPTATLKVGDSTKVQTGYEYFEDRRFNDRGIPSQNGSPFYTDPKTFFGDPTQNYANSAVNTAFVNITHDFDSTLKLRNYTRFTDTDKIYQNVYAGSAVAGGNLNLVGYNNYLRRDNFTNQTDVTKKFDTGSLHHTALVGTEVSWEGNDAYRNTAFFNNATTTFLVPASNPISTVPVTFRQSATDANNHSSAQVLAAYAQDQVDINKYLQLLGGVRMDNFDMEYHDNRSGLSLSRIDNVFSPRGGIIVKPQDNVSLYTSYSKSFLPASGDQFSSLTTATDLLRPESLTNYEVGAKWDVRPDLSLTTAVYQLNRTNTRAVDPNNPTLFVPTGESRTRGFEIGSTGKVTDKWQIIGGYSYQDAVITSATSSARKGAKVALVPTNMASLWNKYDFTKDWAAAIGVINQSRQFAAVDDTVRLKGYTRLDGALFYNITPAYRAQLNVENLLDKRYISTADGNNNISPGSPQTFKVSLVANF